MRPPAAALAPLLALAVLAAAVPGAGFQHGSQALALDPPTVVRALAVAETRGGFVGSVSTVSITVAPGGTGHVFVDTSPLAQVDMQGSARLAVRVAGAVTGVPVQDRDYFFVVRSDAPVIGGPSAGGILTVGTIAALKGWAVNQSVMMTGTITPNGDIGPIGGVVEKIEAAARGGATLFLFPEGQENATRLGGLRAAPLHLPTFCQGLGIRCQGVATVEDAVRHVTGHEFRRQAPPANVTSAGFLATMQPLAQNLTQQARQLVVDASAHFDRAARTLPASARNDLNGEVQRATRALLQAQTAYDEGRYYTASSYSYQASVAGRSVDYATGVYEAADRDRYVRDLVEDAESRAARAVQDATREARSVAHLEALGAAQERATEAERAAANARRAYQQGSLEALSWAAQARERSASVGWWLDIASRAPGDGGPIPEEVLQRTARDLVDTARESVVYARVLLQEQGLVSPDLLTGGGGAEDLLARAEADLARGFHPAAIFEALGADVRASAALELAGQGAQLVDAKLARARERAAEAIVQARSDSLEPILAQSYFEFAGDLADADDALAFYNSARSVARLGHNFFGAQAEERPSRFIGFDPVPGGPAARPSLLVAAGGAALVVAVLLLGLVVGTGFGVLIMQSTRHPQRQAPPPPPPPAAPPAAAPPPDQPAPVDPFLEYQEREAPPGDERGRRPETPRLGEDVAPPR